MKDDIKKIKASQLLEEILLGKNVMVVNVLDKECFDACCIKGSINIVYEKVEDSVKSWNRDKDIVVYSSSDDCSGSTEMCKKLISMGFKNVRVYEGGIKEWLELGYPYEGQCKEKYLTKRLLKDEDCSVCFEGRCKCSEED